MSSDLRTETETVIFECIMCGKCCLGYGGTYVSQADIHRIADFLSLTPEAVKEKYCCISGSRYLLAQGQNDYCVFWDQLCTIHPVKPKMCRAWPFIPSVLADPANWQIMAGSCPGILTDIPQEIIQQIVRRKITQDSLQYPPDPS